MVAIDHTDMRAVLAKVKEVSEGERNPKNQKPGYASKRCMGGAYAMDLGATRENRAIAKALQKHVKNGFLEYAPQGRRPETFFFFTAYKLTQKGEDYLSAKNQK